MRSLRCVTSAGDGEVFLPSDAARGEFRFQLYGVLWLIPSNIPGQSRWTSHKHRCMPHRRSVFHWYNMSRNQSRKMWSTWTLWRFAVLLLGSSSTSAAAGANGGDRGGTRSFDVDDLHVCERPGRWFLLVATRPAAVSGHHAGAYGGGGCASEEHVPTAAANWGGASGRPPPPVWWPTQNHRQGDGGPLGPHVIERGGVQIIRRG